MNLRYRNEYNVFKTTYNYSIMHKLLLLLTFTIMVTCMKAQDLKLDSTNIDVIIKDMTLEEN